MIETILKGINNRDIASFFWIVVVSLFLVIQSLKTKSSLLRDLKGVLIAVTQYKILIILFVLLLNTLLSTYILSYFDLWDFSQVKNTFLWLIITGLALIGKSLSSDNYKNLLNDTILTNLKLTIFLEFFINLYVFSLSIEIFLVFITSILAILSVFSVFSENKTEVNEVKAHQFLNIILSAIGILLFTITIYNFIKNPNDFLNQLTLLNLITPINLTLLSLPSILILFIIKSYENFFTYYNVKLNQSNKVKAVKYTIIKRINFKINSLNMLREIVMSKHIHTLSDVNHTINLIEKHRQLRKNPPYIPIESGWSPFIASKFLINYGIKCNFYKPLYNGWFAQSKFFRVGNLLNNITYYISGNEREATRLCLKIDLYELREKESLLTIFCTMVEQLYSQATNHKIDYVFMKKIIELSSYTKDFDFFSVSIIANPYEHREGYLVSFILKSHNHSDL